MKLVNDNANAPVEDNKAVETKAPTHIGPNGSKMYTLMPIH